MIDFIKGIFKEVFGSKSQTQYTDAEYRQIIGDDDEGEDLDLVLDSGELEDDAWLIFKNAMIKVGRVHYIGRGSNGNAFVATFERDKEGNPVNIDTGEPFDEVAKFMNGE